MRAGIEVRDGKRGKVYRAHVWSKRDNKLILVVYRSADDPEAV